MVEFITKNPAAARMEELDRQRQTERANEQAAFQNRYAQETAVNTDDAIRRGLAAYTAGPAPAVAPPPSVAPSSTGGATPVTASAPAPMPAPAPRPSSPGMAVANELGKTQGGGAAALKLVTADHQRNIDAQDQNEDRAWKLFANAKTAEDLEVANNAFRAATGRDLPPGWRSRQAVLRAAAVDEAAQTRYPTDVNSRRQFIQLGMTSGLTNALQKMPGEATTKTGAGSQQTWQIKHDAWLELYPNDRRGALDYANGRKSMDPGTMRKAAVTAAQKEMDNNFNLPEGTTLEGLVQKWFTFFNTGQFPGSTGPQMGGPGTAQAAPAPTPAPAPAPAPTTARGSGTRQDPLIPGSQADINNAPTGTVFQINGKLMVKP